MTKSTPRALDVLIVGAGFAGMYLLHRMRQAGLSAHVYEAADGVGGTWYWNRYPGARCDVESMQYSFGWDEALQQEWKWSERFAGQPEILQYANHVADRYDLRRDITFETRISAARYDEEAGSWDVRTEAGETITCRYVVMATGCLSTARIPDFPGLADFKGRTFHTGWWPHHPVDFTGRRVAVVGTGSSAIQSIPVIAEQAAQLTVFQRTPNFSIPTRNGPMDDAYEGWWKDGYARKRVEARATRTGILNRQSEQKASETPLDEQLKIYEARWQTGGTSFMGSFADIVTSKAANDVAAEFVRNKIRGLVRDPRVAELLCPTNHPIGTKRICVDSHYYETYNRPNVTLVDVRNAPITHLTESGLAWGEGKVAAFDDIVFATGFDAMTGTLTRVDIRGRAGQTLKDKWEGGPQTYLGLMTAGFPNLFMITGPGSPSVLSNMMVSIEQHVDWITDCLVHLKSHGMAGIEARPDAEGAWVAHVNEVAHKTLYPQANSWYMGANIPGKPQVFMPYIGGVGTYRDKCDEVAAKGYEGFRITGPTGVAQAAE
ncbi:MAG: NAD(P)/FAD-dependent oxidoreductase [Acetobacteraceae bacterium]|nr:NAD(P)/FAD-dependent oxidoreductase [Acetobacteraceae bacterium]